MFNLKRTAGVILGRTAPIILCLVTVGAKYLKVVTLWECEQILEVIAPTYVRWETGALHSTPTVDVIDLEVLGVGSPATDTLSAIHLKSLKPYVLEIVTRLNTSLLGTLLTIRAAWTSWSLKTRTTKTFRAILFLTS